MSPPRTLALKDHLCFALYGASMAVTRAYKPLLDELGITYPQYLVLASLWERDERSVGEIAEQLFLESSTVTPLVKRLEASGLLARRRNPADERQVLVTLTEDGRRLQTRCGCLGDTLIAASGMALDDLLVLTEEIRLLRDAVSASLSRGRTLAA